MKTRKLKAILAAVLSLVLILGMTSISFAAQEKNDNGAIVSQTADTDVEAALTKTLIMGQGTVTPGINAVFTFTPVTSAEADVAPGGGSISAQKSGHASINPVSIVIAEGTDKDGTANDSDVVEKQSGNFLEGVGAQFTAPGIYVYDVKESTCTKTSTQADGVKSETLKNSEAVYRMYLHVAEKSDQNGYFIEAIGVKQVKKNGTPGSEEWDHSDDAKVDPTPNPKDPTDDEYEYTDNSDMRFVNSFERVMDEDVTDPDTNAINVEKVVAGTTEASDLATYFNFKVTVTAPAVSEAESYKAYIVENGAKVTDVTANGVTDAEADGAIIFTSGTEKTVALKHGQKLVFEDASVGAHFEATEDGYDTSKWTPDTKATENGTETADLGAASGDRVSGQSGKNNVVTTNRFKDDTPTGILLNNLPFFLILLAAVGAVVAFAVIKGRRRAQNMA